MGSFGKGLQNCGPRGLPQVACAGKKQNFIGCASLFRSKFEGEFLVLKIKGRSRDSGKRQSGFSFGKNWMFF